MADMLVNLYRLKELDLMDELSEHGITIRRTLAPDIHLVKEFIRKHFSAGWESEASVGLTKTNSTCFIAIKNAQIIGFACYDATAKGYFGPTGVHESFRNFGIGSKLLLRVLSAMYDSGYGYAIIGGVGGSLPKYYKKVCNAILIENSESNQSVYQRMIKYNK